MRERRRRLTTVLLVVAAPLLVAGGLLTGTTGVPDAGPQQPVGRTAPIEAAPSGLPTSLVPAAPSDGVRPEAVVLPTLDVRAEVTPISTGSGALTPPPDPRRVGWWADGARPGTDMGAVVLTGVTGPSGTGVFDDLDDLSAGDRVLVLSGGGSVPYAVESVRTLTSAELARERAAILGTSGPGRLVLVTVATDAGATQPGNVVVTAHPA